MGGMLLNKIWNLPENRLSRSDYLEVQRVVIDKLVSRLGYTRRIEALRSFADKASFGDLDCAVEVFEDDSIKWGEFLKELFGFQPHKNANVYSFPVNGFQVDVLLFSREIYDSALNYYAFENGNFVGRLADKLGLSYGHRGLYLQVPLSYFDVTLPAHHFKEILVTRDPDMVYKLLGFDYEQLKKGFNNFLEMAQWVARSRYFAPQLFQYDALNHTNRTRNKKRPVYAEFVEWCASQPAKQSLPSVERIRCDLLATYTHIGVEMDKHRAKLLKDSERRAKFNGNLIAELKNVAGAELGRFIVAFKKSVGVDFDAWLDANSAESVKSALEKFSLTES